MPETIQPSIDRARSRIETEHRLLRRERAAFSDLLGRISTIQVESPRSVADQTGGTMVTVTATPQVRSTGLARVREAYRETVMAVPHYEAEYDESLAQNLAVEFSPALASHIIDGEALTTPVYNEFRNACRQARNERQRTLQHLERERDSLDRYGSALDEIEAAVSEAAERIGSTSATWQLSRIDERLATLESRCEDLAAERQTEIHEWATTDIDGIELGLLEYLYGELETTTPVLTDVTSCLETIRHKRSQCLR